MVQLLERELSKDRKGFFLQNGNGKESFTYVYHSDGGKTPHSFVYTDLNRIYYYKLPVSVLEPLTQLENFDIKKLKAEVLPYFRREQKDNALAKTTIPENDTFLTVMVSEFHYYIVRNDCVTIINLISQKLVEHKTVALAAYSSTRTRSRRWSTRSPRTTNSS